MLTTFFKLFSLLKLIQDEFIRSIQLRFDNNDKVEKTSYDAEISNMNINKDEFDLKTLNKRNYESKQDQLDLTVKLIKFCNFLCNKFFIYNVINQI